MEGRKIVVIDAGHGGMDSGALSEDGLQEKDVVLDIAKAMANWNASLLDNKYDIYLTRSSDTLISLNDRTKLAKYLKPDIFISLHCNHIEDPSIKGVELYTYDANELSIYYARVISKGLNKKLGFKTREVKQANFHVLRKTKEYCLALLIELGYLSNADELHYLKKEKNRKALALAILQSI